MTCGHDDSTINIVMGIIIIIIIIIIALSLRNGGGAFDTVCPLVCKWGQLPPLPLPRLRRLCYLLFYRVIVSDSTYHCLEESRVLPAVGLDANECH